MPEPLIERLINCLDGIAWEVIYVDDDFARRHRRRRCRALARRDPRVRCVHASAGAACRGPAIEGILAIGAPFIGVIDADLQHDGSLLPQMLAALKAERLDLVVGSAAYVAGGSVGEWDNNTRRDSSHFATRLTRLVVAADLTDPMSGASPCRREAPSIAPVRTLSGQGFKNTARPVRLVAAPPASANSRTASAPRIHGESKLDTMVAWEFLMLLIDKLSAIRAGSLRSCSPRWALSGVGVHLVTLSPRAYFCGGLPGGADDRHDRRDDRAISPSTTCSPIATSGCAAGASSPAFSRSTRSAPLGAVANVGIASAAPSSTIIPRPPSLSSPRPSLIHGSHPAQSFFSRWMISVASRK